MGLVGWGRSGRVGSVEEGAEGREGWVVVRKERDLMMLGFLRRGERDRQTEMV